MIERTHQSTAPNLAQAGALRQVCTSTRFISVAALVFRLIVFFYVRHRQWMGSAGSYGYEVGSIAAAIVSRRGFSSPSPLVLTGPTAWLCPIYPYFVAGIFKIWGTFTSTSHNILVIANCFFSVLVIFPIRACATRTFNSTIAAASCWLWVLLPFAWWIPVIYIWDTTLSALTFIVILWATLFIRDDRALLHWLGYGVLWGAGVLINAEMFAAFPFFFVWLVSPPRRISFSLGLPASALLSCLLLLTPWTIRNRQVLGKWVPLRSNFGLELWLGNNSAARDINSFAQHPTWNMSEAAKFQRMGEINYIAAKQRAAVDYMRAHPGKTLRAIAGRIWSNWFAVTDRVSPQWSTSPAYVKALFVANFFMVLFGALGLASALRENAREALPYLIVVLVFPLPYYLTHTLVRYRFPIEPILTILAAYGVSQSWTGMKQILAGKRAGPLLKPAR